LVALQAPGLPGGDDHQQLPEVVAVLQPGELAPLGAAAEAVEGAEGHVLLVGGEARAALELLPGQADQPPEVALPELLGRGRVAGLELPEPVGDRPRGGHRGGTPSGTTGAQRVRAILRAPRRRCKRNRRRGAETLSGFARARACPW